MFRQLSCGDTSHLCSTRCVTLSVPECSSLTIILSQYIDTELRSKPNKKFGWATGNRSITLSQPEIPAELTTIRLEDNIISVKKSRSITEIASNLQLCHLAFYASPKLSLTELGSERSIKTRVHSIWLLLNGCSYQYADSVGFARILAPLQRFAFAFIQMKNA